MTLLLVAVAGAVGAPARVLVDRRLARPGPFPLGILVVNVTGSFALGLVVGLLGGPSRAVVGTGFLGAYTTFSTFAVDVAALPRRDGARYAVASVAAGLAAAAAGLALA
jgi:CrcB protein